MNETDGIDHESAESSDVAADVDTLLADSPLLSADQYETVVKHLESIDYTNGSILYTLNLGFVLLAACLIFLIFWQIFKIAFGR